MEDYLIDSGPFIDAIRGKNDRWSLFETLVSDGGSLSCSVVTVAELYAGMRSHEVSRTEALLGGFRKCEVTAEIARHAGLLKNGWAARGYVFSLPDMMIAATAIAHGLVLVTSNIKDFPMPELRIYPLR